MAPILYANKHENYFTVDSMFFRILLIFLDVRKFLVRRIHFMAAYVTGFLFW